MPESYEKNVNKKLMKINQMNIEVKRITLVQ